MLSSSTISASVATHHADSDAKKQACFKRGLNPKLKDRLAIAKAANYNEFANMAITQEDAMVDSRAHKKRKAPSAPISGAPPCYRMVPSPSQQMQSQPPLRHPEAPGLSD